jgi:hypothetical protein
MHEPLPISALPDVVLTDVVPYRRHVLQRDYETRSPVLLKTVGAHRYAADPRTSIICAAYAVDDGPVHLWLPGYPVPPEFVEAAVNPHWGACAHNAVFESLIEQHILVRITASRRSNLRKTFARWRYRWRSVCQPGWMQ